MINKLESYGEWTYKGAWVLEITAAIVGLSIAALLLYQSLEQGGWPAVINMIPFIGASVMVAFAELTKIPLATLLFSAPLGFKPFVLIALLGMAFITFESVFQGLEQSITIRQLDYQDVVDDLKKVQSDIALIESGDTLERLSSDKSKLESSIAGLEARLIAVDEQRKTRKSSVLMNQLPNDLAAELANLRTESQRSQSLLESATNEFEAWKAERQGRYDDQKTSWEEQIKTYVSQGMRTEAKAIQNKLDSFAHPRTKPDWKKKATDYSKLESESRIIIQKTEARIDDILKSARTDPAVVSKLDEVDAEAEVNRKQIADQIGRAQTQLLKIQDEENTALTTSLADNERLSELRQQAAELESQRRRKAQLDQIRRLAASGFFSSDEDIKAEDVSDAAAKKVGVIWAGSLAVLAALVGPLTAIVALALQSIADHERRKTQNALGKPVRTRGVLHKLFHSIRSFVVNWRRKRVETRIQEREIQVPQYVYVPVPMDNPQELLDFLDNELPDEVKAEVEGRVLGLQTQPDRPVVSGDVSIEPEAVDLELETLSGEVASDIDSLPDDQADKDAPDESSEKKQ